MKRTTWMLIESHNDSGIEWVVGPNHNPTPEQSFVCASADDARKAVTILNTLEDLRQKAQAQS